MESGESLAGSVAVDCCGATFQRLVNPVATDPKPFYGSEQADDSVVVAWPGISTSVIGTSKETEPLKRVDSTRHGTGAVYPVSIVSEVLLGHAESSQFPLIASIYGDSCDVPTHRGPVLIRSRATLDRLLLPLRKHRTPREAPRALASPCGSASFQATGIRLLFACGNTL